MNLLNWRFSEKLNDWHYLEYGIGYSSYEKSIISYSKGNGCEPNYSTYLYHKYDESLIFKL